MYLKPAETTHQDRCGAPPKKERRGRGRRREQRRRRASAFEGDRGRKKRQGCRHRQRAGTRRCNLTQRRKRRKRATREESKRCSKEDTAKPDPVEETKKIYDEWRAEEAQYEASQAMLPDKFDSKERRRFAYKVPFARKKTVMKKILNDLADITSAVSASSALQCPHGSPGDELQCAEL